MEGDVLWPYIARILDAGPPTRDMFQRASDEATSMANEDLQALHDQWLEAFRAADRPALHTVANKVLGGCGDDRFMDVRDWLIAHGRDVYERVMADPAAFGDLPHPEPVWESSELSQCYIAIGVDRGVFPESWGRKATVAPKPVPIKRQARGKQLPWRRAKERVSVPGQREWVVEVREALRTSGRYEGPVVCFVVDEADGPTVRFEPSDALLAAVPYGSVDGDSVAARAFTTLLGTLDGEAELGMAMSGLGWFGLNYVGLDDEGGDRWVLEYVPSRLVLDAAEGKPEPPLVARKVAPTDPSMPPAGSPTAKRPWWLRLLKR